MGKYGKCDQPKPLQALKIGTWELLVMDCNSTIKTKAIKKQRL